MTSEVVVMNRLAVALAADSAVTVSTGSGDKIFQSAIKLFALSKRHPVGAMIFSAADVMEVPWETVFKVYREDLGDRSFPKLTDYAEDFLEYLDGNTLFFPEKIQDKVFVDSVDRLYGGLLEAGRQAASALIMKGQMPDRNEKLKEKIEARHDEWNKLDQLSCFRKTFSASLKKRFGKNIDDSIAKAFSEVELDGESRAKLQELATWSVTKKVFDEGYSGLVFAGFGEDEIFPTMCSYKVSNVVLNKLKRVQQYHYEIGENMKAIIQPFAQRAVIDAFTDGIDPGLDWELRKQTVGLALGLPETVIDGITDLTDKQKEFWKKKSHNDIKAALKKFFDELQNYKYDNHTVPFYLAVRSLPKDDLAATAEPLVSLSSFQKKVSMDSETVAGPVDVAVISKGDGFIWIKRKHYFEPEKNFQFFRNYYARLGQQSEEEPE